MSGKADAKVEVVKCEVCGKHLTRTQSAENGIGHRCESLREQGWNAEKLAQNYALLSATEAPTNYVKVAEVDRAIKAHPEWGCTISKMVKALGRDRGLEESAHPTIRPVYVRRVRYIHQWYLAQAGQKAIASGDYTSAPKA